MTQHNTTVPEGLKRLDRELGAGHVGKEGEGRGRKGKGSCEMIAIRSESSSHHALCGQGVSTSAACAEDMQMAAGKGKNSALMSRFGELSACPWRVNTANRHCLLNGLTGQHGLPCLVSNGKEGEGSHTRLVPA